MMLDDVVQLARDNPEGIRNFRLAAVLVKRNKVLGFGFNRRKTHPLQKKYGITSEHIYLHAEIDAVVNALRRQTMDAIKGSKLLVARVKKNGSPALAMPCSGCMRALAAFGIADLEYTT